MVNISELLTSYSEIQNPLDDKKAISELFNGEYNIQILENQIFFRGNVLVLKIPPTQRSLIFIKQKEIIQKINNILKKRNFISIRF